MQPNYTFMDVTALWQKESAKLKARLPRGFVDRAPAELLAMEKMISVIKQTYELYGFEPLETPMFEYTDALGKFLPDQDRPNAGVFSLQDDDEQWMSLRYDLTAPLARHVAENSKACQSLTAVTALAMCSATKSRDRAASASSCSLMQIPLVRLLFLRMPKSA